MSYTKTTWQDGVTPLSAANMNKIENGIYNSAIKPTNESTAVNGQILIANGDGTSTFNNILAVDVIYDNTIGLVSENVQDAIDELYNTSFGIRDVLNFTGTTSYTNISFAWSNPASLEGVILFCSSSDITNFSYENCLSNATQIYSGTGTSYNHSGLTIGTTYYYKIFVKFSHYGTKYSTGVALTKSTLSLPTPGSALSTYSWNEINLVSLYGTPSNYWSIGDEKNIVINGETITIQIYGFNHDTLSSNGSTKAGITFGTKHLMATTRQMNSTNTNVGGWGSSAMRSWITGTLIGQLPSELQSILKTVNKLTSAGNQSSTIVTTEDKVFLFSEMECFGSVSNSKPGEGSKYSIFSDSASRVKKLSNGSGSASEWYERSPGSGGNSYFAHAKIDGTSGGFIYPGSTVSIGVALGFCV